MDQAAKKRLLRTVPYGLYVATTKGDDGEHAFLLSWVTQCSFDPPLVVCCVHREARAYKHLTAAPRAPLAVSVLGVEQQAFATEVLKGHAIEGETIVGEPIRRAKNGCVMVPSCLGALELEVVQEASQEGDHAAFVCRVTEAHAFREGAPMTHESTGWKYGG